MPKILQSIAAFIILFLIAPTQVNAAALPTCNSANPNIRPSPLIDTAPQAIFTIDIGNNNVPNVSKWQMEFQCSTVSALGKSLPYAKIDTTANPDGKTISGILNNSSVWGIGCEFNPINNPIKIKVKAITAAGSEVDICESQYQAQATPAECTLAVNPQDNITFTAPLEVSGKDLKSLQGFVLFFDDDAIEIPNNPIGRASMDIPGTANVSTPNFDPKKIPQELMTPGSHTISLRRRNSRPVLSRGIGDTIISGTQEKDFYGSPLCPVLFTVGKPDQPGSVFSQKNLDALKGCTAQDFKDGKCSLAGGKEILGCTDVKGNPGIATAIGCIHTNPAEFTKDLLKFIIGIGGGLAFLMMLLGAYQMLSSGGNPEGLKAGQERLTSAVIGLLFIIFSILLLQIIGVGILAIPGFK